MATDADAPRPGGCGRPPAGDHGRDQGHQRAAQQHDEHRRDADLQADSADDVAELGHEPGDHLEQRPRRRRKPTTEDTKPSTAASTRTDRFTCLPLAPSARSSANSRVRWCTTIENVL